MKWMGFDWAPVPEGEKLVARKLSDRELMLAAHGIFEPNGPPVFCLQSVADKWPDVEWFELDG